MTLTRWLTPKQTWNCSSLPASALRDEIDQMFNRAFGQAFESPGQLLGGWIPAVDFYEDKESFTVKCEIPGLQKEDIDISLHEGFLTISGERKQEEKKQDGEVYRTERYDGRFSRSIALPGKVDSQKINATYKNGVLTVTLPKAEEAKPKQVQVQFN